MQKIILFWLYILCAVSARSQTLGGNSVFNFLKTSNSPQLSALGGINISQQTRDIGLSFHNPALLRPSMHGQAQVVFTSLPGTIQNYHFIAGHRVETIKTNFAIGVNYFNYGKIAETDAAGNLLGEIHPADYVIQFGASRAYENNWHYGAALKFIYSSYGTYRSSGIAIDAGITYSDTARFLQIGLVMKNMGLQVHPYEGSGREELPFDLQVGFSKKLAKAPLQFSVNLHHLHQFDIRYNDTAFDSVNGGITNNTKGLFFENLFNHFVFSTQLFLTEKVEISAGYNYLRRKELTAGTGGNGLNGFSFGAGVIIKKIQIRYSKTFFQSNLSNNQVGIGFSFSSFDVNGN